MTLPSFITLLRPDPGETTAVGTLGPPGTSSEVAATLLAHRLATPGDAAAPVHLFDTYEEAGAALHARRVTHVVVANAYKAVHHFYMDAALDLSDVFVMDTPLYGIAVRCDAGPVPVSPTIASHPSPVPIIDQLLPRRHTSYKVIHSDSTSAAARAAVEGTADLALTTVPAAQAHGLKFISRTRPIRMVWSVFTRQRRPGRGGRAA
ncbi:MULTISPECIES: hypothetical protein [unclassified Streptomyces]|uniref:hypothetical protein n=1 Tax=unclassified Streptomyces TaxID=2593676 RepID=UPI001F04A3E5|nr:MULTISPECIES: hypothetical protein [unclassified Streptomyces]MCH0564863.1 hypothetical protein [Streptomyces sp. MUM 2J]MCH0569863.1 hypothetical protein [Streptomyces sp. MUM 136J]